MQLKQREEAGFLVMTCVDDRLDALVAVQFKDRFRDLANATKAPVIIDMSNVEFMDSSGLGALVAVFKLVGRDRLFRLAGLREPVERVLKLTRMDSVFSIFGDVDAAISGKGEGRDATRQAS